MMIVLASDAAAAWTSWPFASGEQLAKTGRAELAVWLSASGALGLAYAAVVIYLHKKSVSTTSVVDSP